MNNEWENDENQIEEKDDNKWSDCDDDEDDEGWGSDASN